MWTAATQEGDELSVAAAARGSSARRDEEFDLLNLFQNAQDMFKYALALAKLADKLVSQVRARLAIHVRVEARRHSANQAKINEAQQYLTQAIHVLEGDLNLQAKHRVQSLAGLYANLGTVLSDYRQDFRGAAEALEMAVHYTELAVGNQDSRYATMLSNLAKNYGIQGHRDRAEGMLARAVDITADRLNDESEDTAAAVATNRAAVLHITAGFYENQVRADVRPK